jgi:twitching motility protein PilT
LVFATLHTYGAAQAIDRIVDVFPPHQQPQIRTQLAMTLRGIIAQQLVPKKGGGRIAVREILVNNAAVANLIREGKIQQIKIALQTGAKFGMITLEQDFSRLIKEKLVEEKVAKEYLVG